jgi:hypothetical protein
MKEKPKGENDETMIGYIPRAFNYEKNAKASIPQGLQPGAVVNATIL